MKERLRYTGVWPPIEVLHQYPNWEYALDEEDIDGQDETTIRPQEDQNNINDMTVFTAAEVKQADGSILSGILSVVDGQVDGVDVLIDDVEGWRINKMPDGWEPYIEDWKPVEERMLSVSLDNRAIFPLRFISVLKSLKSGKKLEGTIG